LLLHHRQSGYHAGADCRKADSDMPGEMPAADEYHHAELEGEVGKQSDGYRCDGLVFAQLLEIEQPQAGQRDCIHIGQSRDQCHGIQPLAAGDVFHPCRAQQHNHIQQAKAQGCVQFRRVGSLGHEKIVRVFHLAPVVEHDDESGHQTAHEHGKQAGQGTVGQHSADHHQSQQYHQSGDHDH